ncbi:MAG: hypothetical protein ABIS44_05410 [Mycobacteriales bacterium]
MEVSRRLSRWVMASFAPGSAERVLEELRDLTATGGQESERVQAALVVRCGGDWQRFQSNVQLARLDWRDALVRAELADDDWPSRLEAILGA